jgi:hypothetical protein
MLKYETFSAWVSVAGDPLHIYDIQKKHKNRKWTITGWIPSEAGKVRSTIFLTHILCIMLKDD